jgi:hypothetical protein
MRNWRLSLLSLVLVGCTREQDYYDVMNEQQASWREITDILKTVKDPETMAAAQKSLKANAEKYAALAQKASALPKPPPAKVIERMKEEQFFMQGTLKILQAETERVSKLEGGPEFLKQYQSSKGLLSAVEQR